MINRVQVTYEEPCCLNGNNKVPIYGVADVGNFKIKRVLKTSNNSNVLNQHKLQKSYLFIRWFAVSEVGHLL